MGGRSRILYVVLAVVALAAPATAAADSIVFIKGGNVHLLGEQGSLRLTDGGGYESPSMADDGTVVAIRATDAGGSVVRHVHRMDLTGRLLNPPTVAVPVDNSNYTGPLGAQVSPDGRLVAFHYFNRGAANPRPEMPRVAIAPTDRDLGDLGDIFAQGYYLNPSWIGSATIVLFGTPGFIPNVQTYTIGSEGIADWFDAPGVGHLGGGELSADGTRFAATVDGGSVLQLFGQSAPPPAAPQPTCRFSGAEGQFHRPRWSPDGTELVWEQPDGLHVADVPAIDDCPNIREGLIAAGGTDPDWGPADVPVQTKPVIQRYALAVAVKLGCPSACRIVIRLVQKGRTISRRAKRLTAAGTARLVLPKKGRKGKATLLIAVDGKVSRKAVRL